MTTRPRLRTAAVLTGLALTTTLGIPTAGAGTGTGGIPASHAVGSALRPSPANTGGANAASSLPILYAITPSQNQAHSCKVIGKDQYGNQAVVCVNLTVIIDGGPGAALPYGVNAQAILLCENSSNVKVQCANISERVQMADAQNGIDVTQNNICGHAYGACPVTGLSAQTGTMDYTSIDSQCASDPSSVYDVWAFAVGGVTVIELPGSGKNVPLNSANANDGSNYSTGHYFACYE
ncbi:hypothetical protein ABH935_004923 [Catenulispora sp. GAS73]|uniref:hypothetical protein n=1 Tax=Catenulispora sp. GAS73 TaxID=3156269 RepID=UPI0035112409